MLDAIRYVSITNEKVEIKELSLGFFKNKRNKATDFTQEIWKHLEIDDLDINDCHAQKYGTDNGVFTKVGKPWSNILTKGHYSMDAQVTLLIFVDSIFRTKHDMCHFFWNSRGHVHGSSTQQWKVLKIHSGFSLKRVRKARWSAHHDGAKPNSW